MNGEMYKKCIKEMVDRISDERTLRRIYEWVHNRFINRDTNTRGKGA
ncbi:MAG: hypothetical protein Q4F83_12510 [Eubacteriales bacterium]|nr:hypothetical protein [Eubacteriales bacterium]